MRRSFLLAFVAAATAIACGVFSSHEDPGLEATPGGEIVLPDGGRIAAGYDASDDSGSVTPDGGPLSPNCDAPAEVACAGTCVSFDDGNLGPWELDGDPTALTKTCGSLVFAAGKSLELQRESSATAEGNAYAATIEFDMKAEPNGKLGASPIVKISLPMTPGDDDFTTRLNIRLVEDGTKLQLENLPGIPIGKGWVHVRVLLVHDPAPFTVAATLVVGEAKSIPVQRPGPLGPLMKVELGKIDDEDDGFVLRIDNLNLTHAVATE